MTRRAIAVMVLFAILVIALWLVFPLPTYVKPHYSSKDPVIHAESDPWIWML